MTFLVFLYHILLLILWIFQNVIDVLFKQGLTKDTALYMSFF